MHEKTFGNKLSAASGGMSKTNISIGAIPMPKSRIGGGGRAKRVAPERGRTASDMSGNCGKLAAGPCKPKG